MSRRELLILQPAATKPEELEELKENRPFVMRGTIPAGAEFVQVLSIPTIVDMVGFSSGGGPPAFAYLFDPDRKYEEHRLWMLVNPGYPFEWLEDDGVMPTFRGVVRALGMLLGAVEVAGPKPAIDELTGLLRDGGSMVFAMIPYKIPPLLRKRAFPHAEK